MENNEYVHDKLHEVIRCQRTFDWDNQPTAEHVTILDEYAQKPPQQQGFEAATIVKVHNNKPKMQEIESLLGGLTPQNHVIAPLVYIWFPIIHQRGRQHWQNNSKTWANTGLHAGIVAKLANELGYATGFCGCGKDSNRLDEWHSWTNANGLKPSELYELPMLILSIGHGLPDTEYNWDPLLNGGDTHEHIPYEWSEIIEL